MDRYQALFPPAARPASPPEGRLAFIYSNIHIKCINRFRRLPADACSGIGAAITFSSVNFAVYNLQISFFLVYHGKIVKSLIFIWTVSFLSAILRVEIIVYN